MRAILSIDPMPKLIKDEEASKVFDMDLFYAETDMWVELEGASIYIPRGFLTDGASVPKLFQGLLPKFGEYYQAAYVHDYLCEYLTIVVDGKNTRIERRDAENYFKEIMKFLKIAKWKTTVMYSAVRMNSNVKSIIYPSATVTKREFEDKIRKRLAMADKAKADQKKKTA